MAHTLNPNNVKQYWNKRWLDQNTSWDVGYASPALCQYIDQISNRQASILIPGCGNAYEASYLLNKGFTDITLLEIAPAAAQQLKLKFRTVPEIKVLEEDFFKHQKQYDFIIEQTFFCAIPPSLRTAFITQINNLLQPNGIYFGLLFGKEFEKEGPPFGGNLENYREIFTPVFSSCSIKACLQSIEPRAGSELFIEAIK